VGEALANGGIAFGAWKGGWSGGTDRETPQLKTYFQFIRDNTALLFPRRSAAEATLIYPRTAAYSGDAWFLEPVRRLGAGLMTAHILFDFTIDAKMIPEGLAQYKMVVLPTTSYLSAAEEKMLDAYAAAGGRVVVLPTAQQVAAKERPNSDKRGRTFLWANLTDRAAVGTALQKIGGTELSSCDAPWVVQIHADRQPGSKRLLVHLVNYNRNQKESGKELPLADAPVSVDLLLQADAKVKGLRFLTPEVAHPQSVEYRQDGPRLAFKTPGFLVYGLTVIEWE